MALTQAQHQQLVNVLMGPKGGNRSRVDAENEARVRGEGAFREFIGDPGVSVGGSPGGSAGGGGFDFSQQQARADDFLGRFRSKVEGFEPLSDVVAREEERLGVPQLRAQNVALQESALDLEGDISKTRRQILAAEDDVPQQFSGADLTQSQLNRLVAERQRPLQKQSTEQVQTFTDLVRVAQRAGISLSQKEAQVAQAMSLAVEEQNRQLLPFQTEASILSEQAAREFSGYTMERQSQLDMLMAKFQLNGQLSLGEQSLANSLALEEERFQNQLALQRDKDTSVTNLLNTTGGAPTSAPPSGPPQTGGTVGGFTSPNDPLQPLLNFLG